MDTHVEEFLTTHKTRELVKVYGPGTALGEFPPQTVDFDALPFMEKVALQNKMFSALSSYNGFWVYILSPIECFEGRLAHTRVRICQGTSVLTKDLVPFSHQVAVSREDYKLIHTSIESVYMCGVRLKGLERPVFYEDDLGQWLCSFANLFSNYDEFRLLSIRYYPNDDPEEPNYDWTALLIIQYRGPPKEIEPFLASLLQRVREFWTTLPPDIRVFDGKYGEVSSIDWY